MSEREKVPDGESEGKEGMEWRRVREKSSVHDKEHEKKKKKKSCCW